MILILARLGGEGWLRAWLLAAVDGLPCACLGLGVGLVCVDLGAEVGRERLLVADLRDDV